MGEQEWLAEQFEAHRGHLQAVAYRMLGSLGEADDAVQEVRCSPGYLLQERHHVYPTWRH
jgi:hypothetical protein